MTCSGSRSMRHWNLSITGSILKKISTESCVNHSMRFTHAHPCLLCDLFDVRAVNALRYTLVDALGELEILLDLLLCTDKDQTRDERGTQAKCCVKPSYTLVDLLGLGLGVNHKLILRKQHALCDNRIFRRIIQYHMQIETHAERQPHVRRLLR
jgi:hypothetical protein